MKHDLPQSLIDAIKNNTLIPFVGAGVSMRIKDTQNNRIFKSWTNSLLDAVQILRNEKEDNKAGRPFAKWVIIDLIKVKHYQPKLL